MTWRTWLPLLLLLPARATPAPAPGLEVEFGARGLERLAWHGQVLQDLQRWPEDGIHIWHMKCFDLNGHVRTDGPYGWGENHSSRTWDQARLLWTYRFPWGEILVRYEVHADALDVEVTERNYPGSGVVLDGASIFPLSLHLPGAGQTAITNTAEAPGVTVHKWDMGQVAIVAPDAGKAIYSGLQAGKPGGEEVLFSTTRPDALQGAGEAGGHPLKPGENDHFLLSVRFANSDVAAAQVAGDAYRAWRTRWPQTLRWPDRRIIGTVYLASSAQGNKTRPAGFPGNPRRYFSDPAVDVGGGLAAFQARVLRQAEQVVANLKRLNAQGVITWDLEGEEYPQDTSYVCAPDQIARAAPEMESVIATGPHAGRKLDDAYFGIIREAGFRVGVCVRPQRFTMTPDGSARQEFLPDRMAAEELIRKMKFAHDRWGATLFYLDSTVAADGSTLPAAVIEQAAAALPDSLLIPEESGLRMARASAAFRTFLFHGDLGTEASVREIYPETFSANLINDVDPAKLARSHQQLVQAVRRGDVLMVHAGYWHENNAQVVQIYREARVGR